MGYPYNYPRQEVVSNCCGAEIMSDSDICLECGEHCSGEQSCKVCEGTGKLNNEKCTKCEGNGYIEVELY